ncbi:unnamed protein product [Clonostachys chloroleuca]|uniref:Heterokaryon incompatibility domain-containing protein n=1 Tax=Clonostachys chloroleuca TaxID=1926264 RepID=A0AA35MBS4_9HYPO|nr:unnamed protein product [Clonostachys chloroleuca]
MSPPSKNTEEYPTWASDCAACQTLWKRFVDPDCHDEVDFGSAEQALSTQCLAHKPLVQGFIDHMAGVKSKANLEGKRPASENIGIGNGSGPKITMYESITRLGVYWGLLLAHKDSVPDHPGTGRILDPDWVDVNILKQWKQTYTTCLDHRCRKKCLVTGETPGAYVALSYVEQRDKRKILDADTLKKLQQAGSFRDSIMSEYATPLIQQAMYLTSAIGERYLWAERPCSIPTTPENETGQIELMGDVFANAVVTIIAADPNDDCDGDEAGSAEPVLAGLKDVSKPRVLGQKVIPFGDEHIMVRNTNIFSLVHGTTPYYEDGWTYQQFHMARRRILFRSGEIHWQCQCSVWHEELVPDFETDKYIDLRLPTVAAGFPDYGSLSHAFTNYNERTLDRDEDVVPAISSFLSVASRTFEGGFLFGIPETMFELSLIWRRYWNHTNIRRRTISTASPDDQSASSGLPSWSWIGWQGMISHGYGEAARINHRQNHITETNPTTEWFTGASPNTPPTERRRFKSTWYKNRDTYKDFTKPLPPGWTRHEGPTTGIFRDEPFLHPDGCDKYIFKHPALPNSDDAMDSWYFPFPVVDTLSAPRFMPEQTRYLFCETRQASVAAYKSTKGDQIYLGADEPTNVATLFSGEGRPIGSLWLPNEESRALFPDRAADREDAKPGLLVDLVVICEMKTYSKTFNKEKKAYDLPIKKEDLIHVLWVEWKDGVAYRLASGSLKAATHKMVNCS